MGKQYLARKKSHKHLSRRDFLAVSAGLAASYALGPLAGKSPAAPVPPTPPKRTLGATGLKITPLSLGGIGAEVGVFKAGLLKGINFIHCAAGYKTLEIVGKALAGKRDQVYLGLKYEPRSQVDWKYLYNCLEKLKVKYVDILFFPLNSPAEALDRAHWQFFEQARKRGMARHIGITTHSNIPATLRAALRAGFWEVFMPSYVPAPKARAALLPLLDAAERKKIGVVAMKTMTGTPGQNITRQKTIIREVLADSSVTTICKGIINYELLEAYWQAATIKANRAEMKSAPPLAAVGTCFLCGECPVCPKGVQIFEVMRAFNYYHSQLGETELARALYAELPPTAKGNACDGCEECSNRCPNGVRIARQVQAADLVLA